MDESNNKDENRSSNEVSSSSSSVSRCPVNYGVGADGQTVPVPPTAAATTFWTSLFFRTKSNNSSNDDRSVVEPVSDQQQQPSNNRTLPASVEEAARYAQLPQPDQKIKLSTSRQVSSIPRIGSEDINALATEVKTTTTTTATTTTELPHHQQGTENETTKWVYPSEQQLYNAMRRKGWSNIPEDTIPTVLQIHNTINERTWKLVESWEGSNNIYLNRFQGRPKDLSPKAFIMSYVLRMYDVPFDRHDWYVKHNAPTNDSTEQNTNNYNPLTLWNKWLVNPDTEQRYVIDYYYIQPSNPNLPPIPYVDARPALDHPRAFYLRTKRFVQDSFPGITTYLQQRQEVLQEQEHQQQQHHQQNEFDNNRGK